MSKLVIETERFLLRPLESQDVTVRYLNWFQDKAIQDHLASASTITSQDDLHRYIQERIGREDVLFLGIFSRTDGVHIGNVKFEPLNVTQGYAVVGIMIGERSWRGQGVATEVLRSSGEWLQRFKGIRHIFLGVHETNQAAIRSYEKVGFRIQGSDKLPPRSPGGLSMTWDLTKNDKPAHHEDHRFFLSQYSITLPLNLAATTIKGLSGIFWGAINNSALLGFYSLASSPSSICQRSQFAGVLAQAILPNMQREKDREGIIYTALLLDSAVVGIFLIALIAFFTLTRAEIVRNLGLLTLIGVGLLSFIEPFNGIAINACNAQRQYIWNFVLANMRPLVTLLLLTALYVTRRSTTVQPFFGVWIWILSCAGALAVAVIYFRPILRHLVVNRSGPIRHDFIRGVRQNAHLILLFRVSVLIFGSLPSLFIAYIRNLRDVGCFAFALTLSGFLYTVLAGMNEQIYSPTIGRLVHRNDHLLLRKRLVLMAWTTLVIAVVAAVGLQLFGNYVLHFFKKDAFFKSFIYLPALLVYQGYTLVSSGCGYALFCMNRFKALSGSYLLGAVAAGMAYYTLRDRLDTAIWCLPLSVVVCGSLSIIYTVYLIQSPRPLQRRSFLEVQA